VTTQRRRNGYREARRYERGGASPAKASLAVGDLRDDGLARLLNGENEVSRGQFDVT
jgi:hypothetical protein